MLPIHCESDLAGEQAILDYVEVLKWVILVEDDSAFDAMEDV